MSIFKLFKRKVGGVIAYLQLEEFYAALSDSDKQEIRESLSHPYQLGTRKYVAKDLDSGSTTYIGDRCGFLYSMAPGTNDNLKERLLLESLKYAKNISDRHLSRQTLAELYYKQERFDDCERYCLDVISEAASFLRHGKGASGANIPVFKRLAIMYEKQGRYLEAIKVSKRALALKQDDGTKGGYSGRITRLHKKLSTS